VCGFRGAGHDPSRFLEIAWITEVMQLKIGKCVADVELLDLRLKGSILAVTCRGRRARKYVNVEPYVIRVEGQLDLRA
jgi:hypothetical protein